MYPEDSAPNKILLLHCDNDWNSLAAAAYPSVEAAKASAERIYPGVSACWKQTGVSEAQARELLAQQWAGHECSFCRRIPPQFDRAVEKNGTRICNICLAEFQKPLGC